MPRFFFLAFYLIVTPRFRRSNFFFSHVLLSKCHRFSWSRLWFAAKNARIPLGSGRGLTLSHKKKKEYYIRVYISGWICQPKGYLWNWYFCYHSNKSPSCYGVILSVTVAFVFNYIPYKEGTPCFELGVLLFGDCKNKK